MFESLESAQCDASDGLNRRPPAGRLPAPSGTCLIDRISSMKELLVMCPLHKTLFKKSDTILQDIQRRIAHVVRKTRIVAAE